MENGGVGGGGDVPENGNDHFLGTQSESAGKSEACAGCPNQQICASAPKGPDPVLSGAHGLHPVEKVLLAMGIVSYPFLFCDSPELVVSRICAEDFTVY
ncbi:cytosolic Fe-S cluster assembly factor NBP35-like isoform X2 [Phragmites australis]|uniref:cytosolic Fe-S cluster assembly factor NBP35-like isoform X2 n=1 Tax=Phragmites australis TaxID=29695 RepID=UPI002D785761|nr:cytosolic Fe-S cluster assembly factor NBP35-like isoform X2 [Phragmites australis]